MRSLLPLIGLLALPLACTPDYGLSTDDDVEEPEVEDGESGLSGRICAPDGETWLSGADVWVEVEGEEYRTTTDADGYFTLTGVPPGEHTVNIQKGSFASSFDFTFVDGRLITLDEPQCIEDRDIRIAVITGQFDFIEHVLDRLGIEYDTIYGDYGSEHTSFLQDPARMEQYDIIFFNCGLDTYSMEYQWSTIGANLRDFVNGGGSIYASDWAYFLVEAAYPNMIDFVGDDSYDGGAHVGVSGAVTGVVRDADIASALGSSSAAINYDLDIWVPIQTVSNPSYTMIEGNFSAYTDPFGFSTQNIYGPLAAKMHDQGGTVLYTSFHNETQSTADMDVILQEIIFDL